jgi:hypothetical protein
VLVHVAFRALPWTVKAFQQLMRRPYTAASASFISTAQSAAIFGYFRKDITVPANLATAIAFVAARDDDRLLCGYKLYVDDTLVNLGPGRGEAPVWGGDGTFRSLPITTIDLTAALSSGGPGHTLALQAMVRADRVFLPAAPLGTLSRLRQL